MSTLILQMESGLAVLLRQLAGPYRSARADPEDESASSDPWSDEALIASVLKGDSQQHFRTLLARYKTRVHQVSLSVLGPGQQSQAEDVCQEVFLKIYQRLDAFRGDCKFSTWLYRIAINTAIDYRRKHFRFDTDDIDEVKLPEAMHTAPVSLEDHDTATRVHQAILKLPDTQRMMIFQYYWLGLKMREIAEILGCPEGTVKVYLLRARKLLAGQLGDLKGG